MTVPQVRLPLALGGTEQAPEKAFLPLSNPGLPSVLQREQEAPRRGGNFNHGCMEGNNVRLGRVPIAADLPHKLEERKPTPK